MPRTESIPGSNSTLAILLFYTGVLLYRFGLDGRGRFRSVVLLNVSCGSGDGTPGFATTDTNGEGAKHEGEKQQFRYVFLHNLSVL